MLVLTRKTGEKVVIPSLGIEVTILDVRGDRVRVGISAPADIVVHRHEVWARIQELNRQSTGSGTFAPRQRITERS